MGKVTQCGHRDFFNVLMTTSTQKQFDPDRLQALRQNKTYSNTAHSSEQRRW